MSNYYRSYRGQPGMGAIDVAAATAAHEAAHAAAAPATDPLAAARARAAAYEAAHPTKALVMKGVIVAVPVLAVYGIWKLFTK